MVGVVLLVVVVIIVVIVRRLRAKRYRMFRKIGDMLDDQEEKVDNLEQMDYDAFINYKSVPCHIMSLQNLFLHFSSYYLRFFGNDHRGQRILMHALMQKSNVLVNL